MACENNYKLDPYTDTFLNYDHDHLSLLNSTNILILSDLMSVESFE